MLQTMLTMQEQLANERSLGDMSVPKQKLDKWWS